MTPTFGPSWMLVASLLWWLYVRGDEPVCGVCDASRCPSQHFCPVKKVKDSCNCCEVCPPSSRYGPKQPVSTPSTRACSKVQCPKFKVCAENIQGLPLCTCPSTLICRARKRRDICSTEGMTYASRCHLRIDSCLTGKRIRVAHRGSCAGDEGDAADTGLRVSKNKRKGRKNKKMSNDERMQRRNRRKRRQRKQQLDDRRRKRRHRNRKQRQQALQMLRPGQRGDSLTEVS